MKLVAIDTITVGDNRQRQDFDTDRIVELADSIQANGLLTPILLRSETDLTLVAGERRLRAVRLINSRSKQFSFNGADVPFKHIPCVFLGDRTLDGYEEAELHENLIRVDLTWQERALAVARLHNLRKAQNPAQTNTNTAQEILGEDYYAGAGTSLVRDSCIIAAHMDDPEIMKAKSPQEAMRKLRVKAEKEVRSQLASTAIAEAKDTRHTLLRGSALDLLPTFAEGTFDCIMTDPPYGINANNFGDQAVTAHEYQDDEDYYLSIITTLAYEGFRITKKRAHLYMCMDLRHWEKTKEVFQNAGWTVWPNPMIWVKYNGMLPRPDHGPRRTYEAILFANKNDRMVRKVADDVILDARPVQSKIHAAQKPVQLYTNLLERTCHPGDSVLDPFAGSGTIFPAANGLQLFATGINLSEDDYNMARLRIDESPILSLEDFTK